MQTRKGIIIPRTDKTAGGAGLRSHVRLDKLNNFTFSFSFVLDKALQLIERPVIKPSVKSFALGNLTDSFEIFHKNCVSVADNRFAHNMVVVPHKAFLSATQLPKKSFGRFCAFALQPFTQVVELSDLCFWGFKENSLACYSEVVYSDINTHNPVATRNWSVDVSGKSYVKEQSSFSILYNLKSLVSPVKVFPIVFRNLYWNILPFAFNKSSNPYLFKGESKQVSIKADRARFYNRFLFKLGAFKIFRSLCYCFTGKIGRKQLSQIPVNEMMKLKSVAYLGFKSFVNSILNSLKKGAGHIKQLLITGNFQFDGGNRFHKLNAEQLIYKPYAGRCPVLMEVSLASPPQ